MGRSPFAVHPLLIGGGLNLVDAPETRAPGEVRRMENMRIDGAGRVGPRPAARQVSTPAGDTIEIFRFPFYSGVTPIGAIANQYDDAADTVSILRINTDGAPFGSVLSAWTDVTARPLMTGAVIGQRLFMAGRFPGGRLAMRYFDAATETVVMPQFDFAEGVEIGPMFPRALAAWNNYLWAAGFGAETDIDRPEVIRFSYLGLEADERGAGDAADPGSPGSTGLFDLDDYVSLSERGAAVHAMAGAMGRLVVLSQQAVHHIFGGDRFTFQAEQLDDQKGTEAQQSVISAMGTLFWWNRTHGPCTYTGGGADDFGYKMNPRLPEIATDDIVGFHAPAPWYALRWYYPFTNPGGTITSRFVEWNYKRNVWHGDGMLPFRIFCAGHISTTSTQVASGEISPPSGPSAPPSALNVTNIGTTSARIGFTPGDTSVGVRRLVSINGTVVADLDASATFYDAAGLAPGRTYNVSVVNVKNGVTSSALTGSFTTAAVGTAPFPPTNVGADQVVEPDTAPYDSRHNKVQIWWAMGQGAVYTQVWRRDFGGSYPAAPIYTTGIDETYHRDDTVQPGQTYVYRLRHQDPNDPSLVSDFTAEVQVGPIESGGLAS